MNRLSSYPVNSVTQFLALLFRLSVALTIPLMAACNVAQPSADSRYYSFDAPSLSHPPVQADGQVVIVGPINFADYLLRTAIVTRHGNAEYEIPRFDHWSGKIEDEFQIALLKNLSAGLPDTILLRYPAMISLPSSISLKADILRFDSQPGADSRLEATWTLVRGNRILASGHFSERQDAGPTLVSAIAAQSELISRFAQAVAAHMPEQGGH